MKILLTGAHGQLGHQLQPVLAAEGHTVIATGRAQLDFMQPARFEGFVAPLRPDWIINCAAYTQVDAAEDDAETAFIVNRDAPGELAAVAAAIGARLLHVSTDFVFDGQQRTPYRESDLPAPLSVYGHSKLAGEAAVLAALPGAIVLRTGWVYSAQGRNFARTMLRLAAAGKPLRVVDDQVGAPTWTGDIARVIAQLLATDAAGLFHFTAAGSTSWHGFAGAILDQAAACGIALATRTVEPIPTAAYPTAATRPAYSVLDSGKISALLSLEPPAWRDSLALMMGELQACADCS